MDSEITLGVVTRDLAERVRGWRNKDLVGLRTPYLLTEEMQARFYEDVVCSRTSQHRFWAVLQHQRPVGMVGLTNIIWENGTAEISLVVSPGKQGRGIGTAAVGLVLHEAFQSMRLHAVYGEVYACNSAYDFWVKAARRFGARPDLDFARLTDRKFLNGRWWDSMAFTIVELSWASRPVPEVVASEAPR